jgi:hypothetical protein
MTILVDHNLKGHALLLFRPFIPLTAPTLGYPATLESRANLAYAALAEKSSLQ